MDRRGAADAAPSRRGDASRSAAGAATAAAAPATASASGRPQRSQRAAAAAAAQQVKAQTAHDAAVAEEEAQEARPLTLPAWVAHELRVEVEGDPREGFPETYCAAVIARAALDEEGLVLIEYEEVRQGRMGLGEDSLAVADLRGAGSARRCGLARAAGTPAAVRGPRRGGAAPHAPPPAPRARPQFVDTKGVPLREEVELWRLRPAQPKQLAFSAWDQVKVREGAHGCMVAWPHGRIACLRSCAHSVARAPAMQLPPCSPASTACPPSPPPPLPSSPPHSPAPPLTTWTRTCGGAASWSMSPRRARACSSRVGGVSDAQRAAPGPRARARGGACARARPDACARASRPARASRLRLPARYPQLGALRARPVTHAAGLRLGRGRGPLGAARARRQGRRARGRRVGRQGRRAAAHRGTPANGRRRTWQQRYDRRRRGCAAGRA
jgi:hypothetical protein